MKNAVLALALVFAFSSVVVAQEAAPPTEGAPVAEQPAPAAPAKKAKKDMKKKHDKKGHKKGAM